MIFTVEETTLAAAFDHSSRSAAVMDMMAGLGMIEDTDRRHRSERPGQPSQRKAESNEGRGIRQYRLFGL